MPGQTQTLRDKIIKCADNIIDDIRITEYVYDEFGYDIDIDDADRLCEMVYKHIKQRM